MDRTSYSVPLLRDLVKLTMDQNCTLKPAIACICEVSESLKEIKETNKEFVKVMQTLTEALAKANDITNCEDNSTWVTPLTR